MDVVVVADARDASATPRYVRVWDFVAARARELRATTRAIEGRRALGVETLARHARRRATSHAPRATRRRPNLKRRRAAAAGEDATTEGCRRRARRRGRLNAARTRAGGGTAVKALRAHAWHAKRWGGGREATRANARDAGDDEITRPANPRTFRRSLETSV